MKTIPFFIFFAFLSSWCYAQTDLGFWTGIAVEKELSKKFELQFEEELRLRNNITRVNSLLTEIGFTYKPNKYYRLGTSYRFTYYVPNVFGNRLTLSNQVRYKLEDFTFNYRLNFQQDFNTEDPVEYKIRNKFGVDYKFNKHWEIGLTGELFYSFYFDRNVLDRYRFRFGVDHNFNKRHRLSGSLMFQQEINTANPDADFVPAVKYKYTFK